MFLADSLDVCSVYLMVLGKAGSRTKVVLCGSHVYAICDVLYCVQLSVCGGDISESLRRSHALVETITLLGSLLSCALDH